MRKFLLPLGVSFILMTALATAQISRGPIERAFGILDQGTLTADSQAISTTATWNNAGVTFTNWKTNVTDTASGAGSLLLDLQVGGNSKFNVAKTGSVVSSGAYVFQNNGRISAQSDGVFTLSNTAVTDFARLQFGGTTSSFPALKRNSTSLDLRLADDSAYAQINASTYNASVGVALGGTRLLFAPAPSISSGFGTSPSILSSNGAATFRVDVGTGGAATSGVVAMNSAATTGWNCAVTDMTTNIVTRQTASTTTTVTVTAASAWAAGDDLIFICMAY